MKVCLSSLLLLIWWPAASTMAPVLRASGEAQSEKTGCFVVVLKKETNSSVFEHVKSTLHSLSNDSRVYGSVQRVIKAITVALTEENLIAARSIPEVEYVEEETIARGMQYHSLWHLDRIDQHALPLDRQYLPVGSGKGVDVYILDSGINFAHEEFENRAKYTGYDPMDNHRNEHWQGRDCHGHGTHVASLCAGKTYGVAKEARVYSVRVLDCDNAGPWSVILQGLDHVLRTIPQRGRPAIVSLSLGGGTFRTVNNAIQNLHSRGILSVSAAGNGFTDACQRTPAGSSYTLTVGGTRSDDNIYSATNYGPCVDIFAPGESIMGADHRCTSCGKVISGTSMSTPMVSGVAAILLSFEPLLSPTALTNKVTSFTVRNAITFSRIPSSYRQRTPNRLLHITGGCGGSFTVPVNITSPRYPGNYPHNLLSAPCRWNISTIPGKSVRCTFTDFDTEANYDVVTVCDGSYCCPSSHVAALSGLLSSAKSFISSDSSLTIEMTSDGTVSRRGIRAYCSSTEQIPIATTPTVATTTPTVATTTPTVATTTPTHTLLTTLSATFLPVTSLPSTQPPTSPPSQPPTTDIEVTAVPSIVGNESCSRDDLAGKVPKIVSEVVVEASLLLQELVSQSMAGLLESKVLGELVDHPATSCQQLAAATTKEPLQSGYYWLRSGNGSSVRMYCDLTTSYGVGSRGYMQVANLDMLDPAHTCPTSLRTLDRTSCGKRLCGRGEPSPGCSSVFFSTFGIPYSRVCGSVIGYQFSTPNAFFAHQYDPTVTIEEAYLDGVSLTYGSFPRKHVWSFAAAIDEVSSNHSICPCINAANTLPASALPPYIHQNFFCDTSNRGRHMDGELGCDDPLWDGRGCGAMNACCQDQQNSSRFCVDLNVAVTADLELRVCGNEPTSNEDTPLQSIGIYVQ